MSGNTIRDFMVALGFSVDNAGAKRMGDTLQGVENKAKSLNTVLLGLATGAVIAVTKTASELDKLYYSSQRIGASASNIRGFEAAITQMGGTAGNALQTLESLAQKVRQSPGYEGMVNNLGVSTRDQNGAMRDRVEVMKDMSKTLAGMEYYQANAYGSAMGIDETTLMAMRDPAFLQNMEKYQKLQKEMGMSDDMAKSGKDFMVQFRDVTMTTKALAEVILMTAGKALIPVLKIINTGLQGAVKWFSALSPEIKGFLAAGLKIATLVLVFGGLFAALSKLAGLVGMLKGLLFVFRALNLAMLASPIGIVLALAAAIGLLYDDYQTWKNGGKSLIDWGEWAPGIETAISKIKELTGVIMDMFASFASHPAETAKGMFNSLSRMMGGDDVFDETPATLNPQAAPKAPAAPKPPSKPIDPIGSLTKLAADSIAGITNFVTGGAKGLNNAMGGNKLKLSEKDIIDIMKVASTEVVGSLKGNAFDQQAAGVIDTILNRTASGKYGKTVQDVVNQRWAFSDINAPRKGAYGSVDKVPMSRVSKRMESFVRDYLTKRANGQASSVGEDVSYANPYYLQEASAATKAWVAEVEAQAAKTGHRYGAGKAVHVHGTPSADAHKKPLPYAVLIEGVSNGANVVPSGIPYRAPAINSVAPPVGNPHKDQINQANIKGNQTNAVSFQQKTDIHVYGSENPQQTAQAVQRQQDAVNTQLARNARSVIS